MRSLIFGVMLLDAIDNYDTREKLGAIRHGESEILQGVSSTRGVIHFSIHRSVKRSGSIELLASSMISALHVPIISTPCT